MKKGKIRIDDLLVIKGLAVDQTEAQALVMAGKVLANEQKVAKSSEVYKEDAVIRVTGMKSPFASRAGEKLQAALVHFKLEEFLQDKVVMDVGSSTGGFTDCVLQHGAKKVYAVDVGTNQLIWQLRTDPRVVVLERTDVRELDWTTYQDVEMIVVDISFNSLARLLPPVLEHIKERRFKLLALVKPQFELARSEIPEGGVVQDEEKIARAVALVVDALATSGFDGAQTFYSPVRGRQGNQEVFLYLDRYGS
jgi:23S rRNA (cytidine1920-2'-O)/16S rRNA (cytidine1409-2'-O)-methyltransferase